MTWSQSYGTLRTTGTMNCRLTMGVGIMTDNEGRFINKEARVAEKLPWVADKQPGLSE